MFDSVRARLTWWYVGVLALTLGAFGLGVYALVARQLNRRAEASVLAALDSMRHLLAYERAEGDSEVEAARNTVLELRYPHMALAVFTAAGQLLAETTTPDGAHAALPIDSHAVRETAQLRAWSGDWLAGVQRVQPAPAAAANLIVAQQSLSVINEELATLRQALLVAVPLALLLAGLGGWFLARKALAPVVAMADQARRIGAENLGERLTVANPRDELGRLAATFNELLARLNAAFDQQRQFMADASHELRTPLSVLHTTAEVMLEQPQRAEREYRAALALMDAQTRRLTRIVEEMFTLARADAGRRPLEVAEFYLDELLAETVQAAAVLGARKGVNVTLLPVSETPFRGDESLLRQMLLNLLDNAIKHTPPTGAVQIRLNPQPQGYEIAVTDTGTGIPTEAQPHIFERFYRVDTARSRAGHGAGSGAGLGLSIARWIAEAHAGKLELRHSDRTGTTFAVALPGAEVALI